MRQGGILSADLYKIYVNPLLDRLNKTGIGAKVGGIICNTSACADDVTINTYSDQVVQILLDIAADFANQERYELQPSKTNIVRIKPSHRLSISGEMQTLLLNDSEIPEVEQVTHIGLEIANTISNAAEANVENNIKKARRATYSLMSTGLHGNNGLDPESSLQLIKTYITPILLYGLELILPNKTLTTKLERFQKKLLKQVLSLPQNTPVYAVYLLTGFLPVELQLHKKALVFFNICSQNEESIEKQLARRQLAVKSNNSNSWFVLIKKLLLKYNLNNPIYLLDHPVERQE